jgi:hypothetical protein
MPTHDHRATMETVFSYEERMIVAILVEQLNILRVQAGLPVLTAQVLRQEARDYVRAHPRGGTPS